MIDGNSYSLVCVVSISRSNSIVQIKIIYREQWLLVSLWIVILIYSRQHSIEIFMTKQISWKKKYSKTYLMFVSKIGIGDRYRCDRAKIERRFLCKFYIMCALSLTDFAVKKTNENAFRPIDESPISIGYWTWWHFVDFIQFFFSPLIDDTKTSKKNDEGFSSLNQNLFFYDYSLEMAKKCLNLIASKCHRL